jgi:AAHS family 4-hydroxybenzoate transporter-like MFS transporter
MAATESGAAGTVLDAREELRSASLSRLHWSLIVSIMAATIFDGYDTLNPSYVIHYVVKPWGLTHSETGFLVSSGLIGFAVGALVHGPIADRYGRRPVLLGALAGAGVFSVLTATLADSFTGFIVLRGVTGLGLGVIMPLGTAYINEFTPAGSGNRMGTLAISGYAFGGVLAAAAGIWLTPGHGWQILYWLGGLSIPLALVLWFTLPESVQYLVMRGRHGEAATILGRARPDRTYTGMRFTQPRDRARTTEIAAILLSARYRPTTIALWACAFLVLFDIYGLSGWMPTLMEARGNGFGTSFSFGALLQIGGVAGGLSIALLDDRGLTNMRRGLVYLLTLATIAVALIAAINGTAVDIVLVVVAGFGIVGGQFVLNGLCAQSYPTHVRSTGTGAMFGVGRVGAILGPYMGGWLLGWFHDNNNVLFIAVAVAAAIGALIALTLNRRPSVLTTPMTADSLT